MLCDKCIWKESCVSYGECPDFTPAEENLEKVIEENRFSYREEFWNTYGTELD